MFNWFKKQKMKNNSDYFQKILNNYLLYRKHTEELSQIVYDLLDKLDIINDLTRGELRFIRPNIVLTDDSFKNPDIIERYGKITILDYTSDVRDRLFNMHKMEKEND